VHSNGSESPHRVDGPTPRSANCINGLYSNVGKVQFREFVWNKHLFTLRQVYQALRHDRSRPRNDHGAFARIPTRADLASTALGIVFCTVVLVQVLAAGR
jgi:hypothetical protein